MNGPVRTISALVLASLVTACSLGGGSPPPPGDASDCTAADPGIVVLCEAIELIQTRYVDPIPDATLVGAGVSGVDTLAGGGTVGDLSCDIDDAVVEPMCDAIDAAAAEPSDAVEAALTAIAFETLDPNSVYLDEDALRLAEEETTGQIEGIGALVSTEDLTPGATPGSACRVASGTCHLLVVSTFAGSPAREAGVLPADRIVSVDGTDIEGMLFEEVTGLIRGQAGTTVTVGFERGDRAVELTMARAAIDIPVAQWETIGDVGYLRLNVFTLGSPAQVKTGLTELLAAGATTVVLDLRDNPGGALQAAIEVASQFLDDGEVAVTQSPEGDTAYQVVDGGVAADASIRVIVVVNRGSASASEVVSGVLAETGRATVIGDNTFGKNTVQQRFPLANGGALKLTIARWVTPGGHDFGEVGLEPDIRLDVPVDLSPEEVVIRVTEAAG